MESIEIILLILVVLVIVIGSIFILRKEKSSSSSGSVIGVFNRLSERKVRLLWAGEDRKENIDYSLDVLTKTIRESATHLSYNIEVALLKNNKPATGYIEAGDIYARLGKSRRKIGHFYPTHNAPKGGFYIGINSTNRIEGKIPLKDLRPGEEVEIEIRNTSLN